LLSAWDPSDNQPVLQDEEEAGETDVPEERSGEVTLMAESEEEPLVGADRG